MVLYLKYYRIVQACCKLLGLKYSPRNVSFFSLKKIIYWRCWVFCCCSGLFTSCGKWGLPSSWDARASHLSLWSTGSRALGLPGTIAPRLKSTGSIVGVHGPVAPYHGIFPEQGSNSCLQHCWQVDSISTGLSGKPRISFLDSLICRH